MGLKRKELTLIHLVSDQTLQNMLPILAYRPARVIQIRSRGRNLSQAQSLQRAVEPAGEQISSFSGYRPHFSEIELEARNPTMTQVVDRLSRLRLPEQTVLNFTGGTKMMSVGAAQVAHQAGIRMFYCDTSERRFLWFPQENPLPGLDFRQVAELLTVPLLTSANGFDAHKLHFRTPSQSQLDFAVTAWPFKYQPSGEFLSYEKQLRGFFRCHRGRIPESRSGLDALLDAPLPPSEDKFVVSFLKAAARNSLLGQRGDSFYANCREGSKRELRNQLEDLSNLLEGSWLELYVVNLLRRSGRYPDVRWSAEPTAKDMPLGETDILCVDREGCRLCVISCKQDLLGRAPLEHMEALAQRSANLGGSHARATLAVLRVPEYEREKYRRWARSLGVQMLIGEQIRRTFE